MPQASDATGPNEWMLFHAGPVRFPPPSGLNVNMLPFIMGDDDSLPGAVRPYLPIIRACSLTLGRHAYLSISESYVRKGETQRRPGVHTEATRSIGWGGGSWGGRVEGAGVYMASTDGGCRAWDCEVEPTHAHGECGVPAMDATPMGPCALYWISDRTPHEAMPATRDGMRQWVRLVGDDIGGWWSMHSTTNPKVAPNAPVLHGSKF